MFRKVPVSEKLPPLNKFVVTLDTANEIFIYRRVENHYFSEGWCWSLRDQPGTFAPTNNNLPIIYWLEEVSALENFYDDEV